MENTMTKLPERSILDGSKQPKTTTGELKEALGKLRDYLFELFGDDSADKEVVRQTLGINLAELAGRSELQQLREEFGKEIRQEMMEAILKRSVPVGSIHYFAMLQPPDGYLKADGSVVSRETYSDLFATIGTTFGEGDAQTTFKLPDLIGRFAEGSTTPGTLKEAGMPNITGRTWGFMYQGFILSLIHI